MSDIDLNPPPPAYPLVSPPSAERPHAQAGTEWKFFAFLLRSFRRAAPRVRKLPAPARREGQDAGWVRIDNSGGARASTRFRPGATTSGSGCVDGAPMEVVDYAIEKAKDDMGTRAWSWEPLGVRTVAEMNLPDAVLRHELKAGGSPADDEKFRRGFRERWSPLDASIRRHPKLEADTRVFCLVESVSPEAPAGTIVASPHDRIMRNHLIASRSTDAGSWAAPRTSTKELKSGHVLVYQDIPTNRADVKQWVADGKTLVAVPLGFFFRFPDCAVFYANDYELANARGGFVVTLPKDGVIVGQPVTARMLEGDGDGRGTPPGPPA